jgi:hypothetical protein
MQIGDLVMFEEEIQIKRCFWEYIERVATIESIDNDMVLLNVQCIPPKQVKVPLTEVQLVPMAYPV